MTAKEEYDSLIANRKQNPLPKETIGEVHHIKPRCLGGTDDAENLVKLTPEEHYQAHRLLPFIYTEGIEHDKLCLAWHQMHTTREGVTISQEEYGILKRGYRSALSKSTSAQWTDERKKLFSDKRKGEGNPVFGKRWHHGEETRKRISAARMGSGHPQTPETRAKISAARSGRHLSPETRRKLSEAQKRIPHRSPSEETRRKMSEAQKARQERLRQERKAIA